MRSLIGSMLLCLGGAAFAAPIAVSTYNIHDAVLSGYGGWAHVYSGSISPVRNFNVGSNTGTIGEYSNGAGTLNDGIIGTSTVDTQLFVQGDIGGVIAPVITLKLAQSARISKIELYGGDQVFNLFPGAITGVTVEIGGQSVTVNTVGFGDVTFLGTPFNDSIDLTGTPLANLTTDTIVLRNFVVDPITSGQFVITEVKVDGTVAPAEQTVRIDVKPFGHNNRIFLQARPAVAVAILSDTSFDARTIDRTSLRFGHTGTEASLIRCLPAVDLNRDGRADLICRFRVSATGLRVGDTSVTLKGRTTAGVAFSGTNTVEVLARCGAGEQDEQDEGD